MPERSYVRLDPPESYLTWGQTEVTVAVGETVTVTYSGSNPDNTRMNNNIGGIATATVGSGSVDLLGVSEGTVTIAYNTEVGNAVRSTNPLTITVTAPTEDQNFLNERGLAHFWDNISSAISAKISTGNVQTTDIVNGAVTTAKLADDAVGWKYLGCVHTETATNQLDFTLPAQYDNYKIIASSVISTDATNGAWQTLSPLNGSTLLNFSGFLEKVEGTNWSCEALTSKDYVSQNTTYPYFSVFHEVLSMRSMSSEARHYMTTSVSGGGSTNGRTTRGNFHAVASTEPTGFRLRMASNYIRSGSIYVWGMNNST